MKIDKLELSKKLSKLKDIVKMPAITMNEGVLFKDGYMIASNSEITVKAKIDASESEPFILPDTAFNLIDKLPFDSVIDIECSGDAVTIKTRKINAKFPAVPAEKFMFNREDLGECSACVPAGKLKAALRHVIYAVPAESPKPMIKGVYFESRGGKVDVVGCDGHRLAWDKLELDAEFRMNIPKPTVEKLLSIGLEGEVNISHDDKAALFKTDDYEVYTRLIDGKYLEYAQMFTERSDCISVEPKPFVNALARFMAACGEKDHNGGPNKVVLNITSENISVQNDGSINEYREDIAVSGECEKEITIGFNPKLLIEALKSFEDEKVTMSFIDGLHPAVISGGGENKALVLPVKI